jgi:hypothetical protein
MFPKRISGHLEHALVFDDAVSDVRSDLEATPFHEPCPPCPDYAMRRPERTTGR